MFQLATHSDMISRATLSLLIVLSGILPQRPCCCAGTHQTSTPGHVASETVECSDASAALLSAGRPVSLPNQPKCCSSRSKTTAEDCLTTPDRPETTASCCHGKHAPDSNPEPHSKPCPCCESGHQPLTAVAIAGVEDRPTFSELTFLPPIKRSDLRLVQTVRAQFDVSPGGMHASHNRLQSRLCVWLN